MGETIKSFLVGLGFGVDDASLAKFNKAISSAALKVTALYASIKVAAAGIFYGVSKISESFEQMGYEMRLVAPPITKVLQLRQEMMKAYSAAGINMQSAIQKSILFNFSLAKTKYALDAVYKSVGIKFLPLLTKQMDIFRSQIYANMPKIQDSLMKFVNFIFKAFEATNILGSRVWSMLQRVYDFFKMLDDKTEGWSTLVLGAIAAWKLLNLSFLATPFGMVIAGITALLTLWDDFKTFREGGQSMINWGSDTTKTIVGMIAVIGGLTTAIVALATVYNLWTNASKIAAVAQAALNLVLSLNPIGLIVIAVAALVVGLTALDAKWNIFGGHVTGFLSGIGGKIMDFVGGPNVAANLQSNPAVSQMANPIGSSVNNNSNQNVNQETNINVQGGPDASSTGRAVAGEQNRVNFDMARNLKGATR